MCLKRACSINSGHSCHLVSEKSITMNKNIPHFKENIYIFAEGVMEGISPEFGNVSTSNKCCVIPPKLSLSEMLNKDFNEFLCIRINLAPRAVQSRLVDWCGNDCCDS